MDITLMYTDSPNNALEKHYSNVAAFDTVYARNNVSVVRPDITLECGDTVYSDANYAYINDFGKFYFIEDRQVLQNGLVRFLLKEDVLMNYSSDIADCKGIVERQKDNYDMYLNDDKIPVDMRTTVSYRNFTGGPEGGQFGLTTITMVVLGGDD